MVDSTLSYERCIEAAGTAFSNGDRASAERALRAAVQTVEGKEGLHMELASALIRLGALKREMGNHAEAEEAFRRALDISEHALGPDDLGLVPALTGLGAARLMRGDPRDAEPLLSRALAISEKNLGADHPDLVLLLNDLSRLYLKQSAHVFAEPLLLRLLALKRVKGEDHPEVATVLASLAGVREGLGRHEAAEQLWRQVLTIRERTLAPNHFAIATAVEHLGEVCAARGKVREALQLFQRAHSIREATLGSEHASLRTSRERIADLQLQASEDSFDSGDAPSVPPEKPRLLLGDPLAITVAPPAPAAPPATPASVAPPSPAPVAPPIPRDRYVFAPPQETAFVAERVAPSAPRLDEKIVASPRNETASTNGKPAPTAVPYMDVLLDIQEELADPSEPQPTATATGSRFASIALFLRQRQAAAVIGVGVVALSLVVVAVAAAARSGSAPAWVDQPSVSQPARSESASIPGASPEVPLRSTTTLSDVQRDVPAGATARPASRARTDETDGPAAPTIPSVPRPTVGRLDSVVRAMNVAVPVTDPFPIKLAGATLDIAQRSAATEGVAQTPAVRPRIIGSMPVPKYPSKLLVQAEGGEVVVRFDVDTTGKPIMSTFAVVGSPHALLSAAVREVIPGMRFDPARTAWPESRTIVDRVEIAFKFNTARSRDE
jgi:TonB family protein